MGLSEIQSSIYGPSVIIAGPGTGKTYTLIKKVESLIDYIIKNNIYESNKGILISTFTNKATEELKYRLYSSISLKKINLVNIEIGTIHKLCWDFLKGFANDEFFDFSLLTEIDQVLFLFNLLPYFGEDQKFSIASEYAEVFGRITDLDLNKDDFEKIENSKLKIICENYKIYKVRLEKNKLLDYSFVIKKFFEKIQDVKFKKSIKDNYNFFFVDEYQDVNNLQNKIFQKLSGPDHNITIVGDPNQSIYGWRGSNVKNLLDFENGINKKVKKYFLKKNFRSSQRLVDAANYYFSNHLQIKSSREDHGFYPFSLHFKDSKSEAKFIVGCIKKFKKEKIIYDYSEVAILFKSLNHSKEIIKELDDARIPVSIIGSINLDESILGRIYIEILEIYLSVLKKEDISEMKFDFKNSELKKIFGEKKIQTISAHFKEVKIRSAIKLTYEIFKLLNLLDEFYEYGNLLGVFTKIATQYDQLNKDFNSFDFVNFFYFLKRKIDVKRIFENGCQLMTIHQSKGLEFPIVFLASQNNRLSPITITDRLCIETNNSNYLDDESFRVFYVGLTRAQNVAIISHSVKIPNSTKKYTPSREFKKLIDSGKIKKKITKINFPNISKKKVKELTLSFNKIRTYLKCPLMYKYRHEWGLDTQRFGGMLFGSNVHQILEIIYKKMKQNEEFNAEKVKSIFNKYWNNVIYRNIDENNKYKKIAMQQILNFFENKKNIFKSNQIFSVEESFFFPVHEKNLLITGRYDLIVKKKNDIQIIDFKTGDEEVGDYKIQLSFYKFCFQKKYNYKNIKLYLNFIKSNQKVLVNDLPFNKIDKILFDVSDNIKKNNFDPKPGKNCKDCPYNSVCKYAI